MVIECACWCDSGRGGTRTGRFDHNRGSAAFAGQQLDAARRGFLDQMAQLGMRWLKIDRQATLAQRGGADRTNRPHDHGAKRLAHGGRASLRLGNLEHVTDLSGAGKQGHFGVPGRNCGKRTVQGLPILGQRPSIDRHQNDLGAARLQPGDQIAIGDSIFLHCDAFAGELGMPGQFRQHFAPGVGFRNLQRGFNARRAQHASGLRTAHHGRDLSQCRHH